MAGSGEAHNPKTGFEAIDVEHEVQLGLMDALESAVREGRGPGAVRAALDGVIGYLDAHFLSEQLLMREHAYPDYQRHVLEHDHALQLMSDLRDRCNAREDELSLDVLVALRRWLLAHIEAHDTSLGRFLVERRVAH